MFESNMLKKFPFRGTKFSDSFKYRNVKIKKKKQLKFTYSGVILNKKQ